MNGRFARLLLVFALFSAPCRLAFGQSAPHTRLYRSAGTYPSIVSVSPNGTVVSKSGDISVLTLLDGYNTRVVSMPDKIVYRVHQSRSGQLWTVTSEGLLLYHPSSWTFYDLPEIRAFLAEPSRHLRQIALLPAEVNHVLVLFPDRLLDFETASRQTKLLKRASDTQLGEFLEIQEGLDDAIWISGTFGVAQVQGPARHLTAQSPWKEYLVPDTNQVNNLQRVFEGPPGQFACAAIPARAENRFAMHWQNGRWTSLEVSSEKLRQAWHAWDDQLWGLSTASLFRIEEDPEGVTLRRQPVSGPQYEVAVENNGVFWVASGEGLVRYAPYLWRPRGELEDVQSSVHSVLLEEDGTVWLVTPAGLIRQQGKLRSTYPWPEELENLPPRQSAFRMADGRIAIAGQNRPMVFDPATGQFQPIRAPEGTRPHLVGELADGAVVVWLERSAKDSPLDLRLIRGNDLEQINLPQEGIEPGADVAFVKEGLNGDLWISLGPTLLRYRRGSAIVEHHGPDNGLRTDRVYALAEVGDGRVWCGTMSRIYEFRGQRWEPILNINDRPTDIVAVNGSVWVSTVGGIHRFQDNAWYFHGQAEGVPSGAVYGLQVGPDQQLWAATSRGALIFHADADRDPPRNLPPILAEEQTPAAGQPTVIQFRAQDKWDYTFPSELLFSYRLDEGSWTPYSNINSRVFQKLSSGSHVLEVQSMDKNGNKSVEPGRIEFAVIVPWSSDPRLLSVLVMALIVTFVLAGLAVNRHLQLKRSYAEVEQIVEQRTRDLNRATEELVHAQKMQALGTMAAGIAHDFNNILSIIKGSAQIIENNVEDKDKIRTRVSRIQTVVEQGSVIVKALLGLGKTGGKELSMCDISHLLHETRKLLSDRFPSSVQIQINVSPELPKVLCAPEVLQQILLNLILNAAEAMHNEGVVELEARELQSLPPKLVLEPANPQENTGPKWVMIQVIDQGGGIPPDNLPRIFEPFFTTKAFSSRRGTGLGLSMVYELAKQLGYGIGVESRIGEGSAFSIILCRGEG